MDASADPTSVKRAYRQLARHHHPDAGGDGVRFHRLRTAYERLADDDGELRPTGGRPSRTFATDPPAPTDAEVAAVAWDLDPAGSRPARELLAVRLASDPRRPAGAAHERLAPIAAVVALSRAPGSRLNPMAPALATSLTSRLTVVTERDDRGLERIAVSLTSSNRRARRALDGLALHGWWLRTRSSSTTQLRSSLLPHAERRRTAVATVHRIEHLLDSLAWSVSQWAVTDPRR